MTLQDLFYLTMSLSAIIITATLIYIAYLAVNTLKLLQTVLQGVKETGESLSVIKDGLQLGALTFVGELISKIRGGGEKNG